ncbi:MAG: glycoside hydrolase family 20 zincin-like fold domain-containing protein, partial [Kiritimatiellae bacterium]|nr:glycoside hydrolase family 20 zincin-like fold domain-containing protein [Kiritimatiellia bacterium]
ENKWPADAPWPAWAVVGKAESQVQLVGDEDAKKLLQWVIPLPKRIRLEGKLVLPASGIGPRLRSQATDIEQTALNELVGLIKKKTGVEKLDGPFSVIIGVCDVDGKIDGVSIPGAEKLRGLNNDDQAYVISPLSSRGIAVAGLTAQGVYYGVKTLQQLLEPGLSPGKVTMPVVAIMDWPDLAERGEWLPWGNTAQRNILYMADRKMNLMEVHNTNSLSFDANGRGMLKTDTESKELARLHAVKWIPVTGHFNSLGNRTGIYKRYPKAEGRGPNARYPSRQDLVVPCASCPEFVQVLAEWMESCASQDITDMNFYLTELEKMQCDCEKCKGKSQYVLEAEACVKAWQIARIKYPKFRIRILLSQGTYNVNDQMLAAVPQPEIGVTYYSGSTTYTAARDPMIYPLLADFAQKGRWLGCYPQLTASWRVACPWSGPQFIKYRMTELVEKRLSCLSGYAPPDNRLYDFNVTAAAEWSWNANGRDEREFSVAWATRRGLVDPEKAAHWAVMLGPVGWDIYGGGVPHNAFFGSAAKMVKNRHAPVLGKRGMFRYFPTVQHMDDDLTVCRKALTLAGQLNDPVLVAETRTIQGYVRMVKAIYTISDTVAGKKQIDNARTRSIQDAFNELQSAGRQVADAWQAWSSTVASDCDFGHHEPVTVTRQTITDIGDALVSFGIKNK